MSKVLHSSLLLLVLILAVCSAEPPRRRAARIQTRLRFLARQEAAEADPAPNSAPAPYPAAGVTPAVPFDLPTETEAPPKPDETYGPPDETYGPPAVEEPQPTYLPPDNTYGPPETEVADGADGAAADDGAAAQQSANLLSQKLIQRPFKVQRRGRPAPLRRRANIVEVLRSEPIILYTLN